MSATVSHETELDRLRAELARITVERNAISVERDALALERDAANSEKARLEGKVSQLQHRVDELVRKLFGRSSEKVDPSQLMLEFAKEEAAAEVPKPAHVDEAPDGETPDEPKPKEKGKKKGHGWKKPPKDLRRETEVLSPTDADLTCGCCGGQKKSIGAPEITERYDYRPASAFIQETVRHRFRCPTCQDGTVIAPLPPPPLASTLESESDRGRAAAGLLSQVVVAKYNDHLPLNRQEAILAREGVSLSRSTLADYAHGTAKLLRPVAGEVWRQVLSRPVIGLDETSIRVVFDVKDPKTGSRARSARIWVYRGLPGEVYFTITETKEKADVGGPLSLLADYYGYVQADAAPAFDDMFKECRRIEVGCNAHSRRKFFESKKSSPKEAAFALATYRKVYEIERRVRDASPEERLRARQNETKPLLAAFDAWLDELAASPALVPGTPLATAVGYSRNHRVALRRFLDDPQLSPDNNAVERALRLVAVGRKNWLFAGSEQAAYDAATHYTLIASCRELGVEPWEYFHDVIKRRAADPGGPVAGLTPRAWWAAREAKLRAAEAAEGAASAT